jgi:hypothetical protein
MAKRIRVPQAKPGELKVVWGREAAGSTPDVCYVWGPGVDRADSRLLHNVLGCDRMRYTFPEMNVVYDPSLLDELKARGYDLSTLTLSIQKKVTS